jgi:hypothetical protein
MRLLTLSKLLVLGGAAAWAYKHRDAFSRRDSSAGGGITAADLRPDPGDPVQGIDEAAELRVIDLEVDALDQADADAAQDLAALSSDLDEHSLGLDTPALDDFDTISTGAVEDTGELYGVHTPVALDTEIPDDRRAMDDGENWFEALEASAAEFGPVVEGDIDVTDDQDVPPHPSDTKDTPVADHGSGGPSGV